jgi:hypothetical protein
MSETKAGLQNAMSKLSTYCRDWALEVNINKSKTLIFTANGRREEAGIQYNGIPIETVSSYKYLGIIFTSSGKFTAAIEDLYKRGLKASFKLANLLNKSNLSYKTSMHLFDHVVKPVLLYGAEIWAPFCTKNKNTTEKIIQNALNLSIEKCHLRYCRLTLGVGRKAPNIGIYGDTGRVPLLVDAMCSTVKYLHRLETRSH